MSAKLMHPIAASAANPNDPNQFFLSQERVELRELYSLRESPRDVLNPCDTNLFIGVFFDGTGNNYAASLNRKDHTHSNIARLYSAYPGNSVPGVLPPETDWMSNLPDYDNYFRIYAPGVGTPFEQVGDSGEGVDKTLGGAAGRLGQVRILWGLAQVINTIARYFLKQSLIDNEEIQSASKRGVMSAWALQSDPLSWSQSDDMSVAAARQRAMTIPDLLVSWLNRLHAAIEPHIIPKGSSLPQNKNPGIVRNIYLSAFGFSRGAAQARVFANWLIKLCELDARLTKRPERGLTLAGFPLTFDFLGLFDTVASVGVANLVPTADGHSAWAGADLSMAISPYVARCLHLVSAHECRRAFPLDSIYSDHAFPTNGEEIVFPGVHSDLGGGYRPGEHGKGVHKTGKDLISRIPLAVMYREARLSGVPLKLEQALEETKDGFLIEPKMIDDFNAYINACRIKSGETGKIVREHWRRTIEWRLDNHQKGGVDTLNSFKRASAYDQNLLLSGYSQFCDELQRFYDWRRSYDETFHGTAPFSRYSPPAFELADWLRINEFHDSLGTPPQAIATVLDEYVHDSFAGFLPQWNNEEEVLAYLTHLVDKKRVLEDIDAWEKLELSQQQALLSREERRYVEYYERTGKIPKMTGLGGREPDWLGAGYLRFRRIYAGADDQVLALLPSGNGPSQSRVPPRADSQGTQSVAT